MSDTPAFSVPSLPEIERDLVAAHLLTRSWTAGRRQYLRRYRGETLRLEVGLLHARPKARCALSTNLNQADPEHWIELPFTRLDERHFACEIPLERRGTFAFRLRFSADDGKTWHWDRVPCAWLVVDPPAIRQIKMYTLIPTATGTIADWLETLPHLQQMGFNMVHLLPLTRMDISRSPYSAADLFALDPVYAIPGDPRPLAEQFSAFADAAREHGIGLCIDLVYNHVGIRGELARRRPEWIVADETEDDGFRRAGWQDKDRWRKWGDLALLNYAYPDPVVRQQLWDYMAAYAEFWASFAARTGGMIRLDNLHSSHEGFSKFILDRLTRRFPDLPIFAELFASQETNERFSLDFGLNLLLGTQWEHHFVPSLRGYLADVHANSERVRYYMPISTHDSGPPAVEFGDVRATLPRYAISCFYSHGITGMAQGVEYGVREKVRFIGAPVPAKLADDIDYSDVIRQFHDLRDASPVFGLGGNLRFIDDGHDAILGAWRGPADDPANGFLMLTNLDIFHHQAIAIDFAKHGLPLANASFEDALTGERTKAEGQRLTVTLPPCGVRIYRVAR